MDKLNYCIQCRTPDGLIGTFGFSGMTQDLEFIPCTPVFPDLSQFYDWARANGWRDNDTRDVSQLYMERG